MNVAGLSGGGTASRALSERAVHGALLFCAAATALTVIAVFWILFKETWTFFRVVSLVEFFTSTRWAPLFEDRHFGVLPLLAATVQITVGASLVAVPLGLLTAIYLHVYSGGRTGRIVRLCVDVLAGVPTIVYGYLALTLVTPLLQGIWPVTQAFNQGSASLAVGLMILPTVSSLSTDALAAVPRPLAEAAYGLGATRGQVVARVMVPAAARGIVAAVLLAMSRAIGETMTVTLAAGNQAHFTLNPLEGVQALTAFIAQVSLGGAAEGTIEYGTIFAVGSVLFLLTFGLNVLGRGVLARRLVRPGHEA